MRRKDGKLNFYRKWNDYKEGFGDIEEEFWLGLSDSLSNFNSRRSCLHSSIFVALSVMMIVIVFVQ